MVAQQNRQQLFLAVQKRLRMLGVGDAGAEARVLCDAVLKQENSTSILYQQEEVSLPDLAAVEDALTQRASGRPLAYILREAYFYGRPFCIEEGVLIPRQDTETLIEAVKETYPNPETPLHIIDIGTGSGNILLTLLLEYPNATGQGTDCEKIPFEVTQKNIDRYQLQNRVVVEHQKGVPSQINTKQHQTTIVVSNPPYIATDDSDLCAKTTKFEPKTALFANQNGLEVYENIIPSAQKILPKDQKKHNLFIEIGHKQSDDVEGILLKSHFRDIICKKDLAERPRILCATS